MSRNSSNLSMTVVPFSWTILATEYIYHNYNLQEQITNQKQTKNPLQRRKRNFVTWQNYQQRCFSILYYYASQKLLE